MNPPAYIQQVLDTQPEQPMVVLDSPPGAGKTGVVELLAVQGAQRGERIMIAAQTNQQAFDLAERIAESADPEMQLVLHPARGLHLRESLLALAETGNLQIIERAAELPAAEHLVVIATSRKWATYSDQLPGFDLQIIEEAYQITFAGWCDIRDLAQRWVMVGDPGQIAPVVSASTDLWDGWERGPQVPAPRALLREGAQRLTLPVSRRLPADSAELVGQAFYPETPFQATSTPEQRGLQIHPGSSRLEGLYQRLSQGASLAMLELPAAVTGERDPELSSTIAQAVQELCDGRARYRDLDNRVPVESGLLGPEHIGVVCGHRTQVTAVSERLGPELNQVKVDTADRFQGLERPVILVHHPLSGRLEPTDFGLDVGRLCVMCSRHRVACILVGRAGITEALRLRRPVTQRVLDAPENSHRGASIHLQLLQGLERAERLVSLGAIAPKSKAARRSENRPEARRRR